MSLFAGRAGRSHARYVQRQVPCYVSQLQFIKKVVHTPVVAQSLFPMACRPKRLSCCRTHGGPCSCCVGRASSTVAVVRRQSCSHSCCSWCRTSWRFDVVVIPVVTRRPFLMVQPVWRTVEIYHLLFDKVNDVLGVRVCELVGFCSQAQFQT